MGCYGRVQLQVREAGAGMTANRTHEVSAVDVLSQPEGGGRLGLPFVVAVIGAALVHAVLDLAQATREAAK